MIITSLPAIFSGRSIIEVFSINYSNTNLFQSISMGYPTFWRILVDGTNSDGYNVLKITAMIFTVGVLGMLITFWTYKKIDLSGKNLIYVAFLLTYSTIIFLPSMHERYGYVYEVIAIIVAMLCFKTIPLFIAITIIAMTTYGEYLFGNTITPWLFALANFICYISYMFILNKELLKESD